MNILLLGGTAEAVELAQRLTAARHRVVYSVVGLVRLPELACEIRTGGFGDGDRSGAQGMAAFCRSADVQLIVDATHPYAARISANAVAAADLIGVECYRYTRPGWGPDPGWRWWRHWADLAPMIASHLRPFFTIGRGAIDFAADRAAGQQWVIRTAVAPPSPPPDGVTLITDVGPFSYEGESGLMRRYGVDALISKDSGGPMTACKLDAAYDLGIPVYMCRRPDLAPVAAEFDDIDDLAASISALS